MTLFTCRWIVGRKGITGESKWPETQRKGAKAIAPKHVKMC
jgi:hypothetical protein